MKKTLLLLIMFISTLLSREILVVTDKEYNVIKQAKEGFQNQIKAQAPNMEINFITNINDNADSFNRTIARNAPDCIIPFGNNATRFLINRQVNTPIVFCMVTNEADLAVPESFQGHISGIRNQIPYREIFHHLSALFGSKLEIATVYSVENYSSQINQIWKIAQDYQVPFTSYPVQNSRMVIRVLRKINENSLFWILLDNNIYDYRVIRDVIKYLNKNKTNILSPSELYLSGDYHANIAIVADAAKNGEQAAKLTLKLMENKFEKSVIEDPKQITCYLKRGIEVNIENLTIPIKWVE